MSNKLDWDEVAQNVCNAINEPYYNLLDLRFIMLMNIINSKYDNVKYRPTFTKEDYDIAFNRYMLKSLLPKLFK